MRRLPFFLIFLFSVGLGYYINQAGRSRDIYQSICELTEDHFYRDDQHLDEWVEECQRRAARLPSFARPEVLLTDVQDLMNKMGVSHFQIYSPDEDRLLWKGEGIDTGLRSRYVEDHLVVYRVLAESSGAKAGVQAGDEILQITGTDQVTPWGAQHRTGRFQIRRGQATLNVKLESQTLTPDYAPSLHPLSKKVAVLEIPSFRSDFFERESWREMVAQLRSFEHLIVDVRENSGGNFVAMLRALSPFTCGEKLVGRLVQPRKSLEEKARFDDNTDDRYQISELDRFSNMGLRTFINYGCFKGRVTVLVSPETSSVAEIFAASFLGKPGARVWGQPTAGDVVLAVWYDLPMLGEGYSVSIPEAVFLTPQGKELEGSGVWPERELFYDLKLELKGVDTWIERATH